MQDKGHSLISVQLIFFNTSWLRVSTRNGQETYLVLLEKRERERDISCAEVPPPFNHYWSVQSINNRTEENELNHWPCWKHMPLGTSMDLVSARSNRLTILSREIRSIIIMMIVSSTERALWTLWADSVRRNLCQMTCAQRGKSPQRFVDDRDPASDEEAIPFLRHSTEAWPCLVIM